MLIVRVMVVDRKLEIVGDTTPESMADSLQTDPGWRSKVKSLKLPNGTNVATVDNLMFFYREDDDRAKIEEAITKTNASGLTWKDKVWGRRKF